MNRKNRKILLAITGASGAIYPKRIIDKILNINDIEIEFSVIITENGKQVWQVENDEPFLTPKKIRLFSINDFTAPFASGSGQYDTMIIAPCSMGTLGRIANGISNDLISRAADVILKERRTLICVARETPYNLVHLKNMEVITLAGGIICPATPSFYSKPTTISELADTVVDRVLDLAKLSVPTYRWGQQH